MEARSKRHQQRRAIEGLAAASLAPGHHSCRPALCRPQTPCTHKAPKGPRSENVTRKCNTLVVTFCFFFDSRHLHSISLSRRHFPSRGEEGGIEVWRLRRKRRCGW